MRDDLGALPSVLIHHLFKYALLLLVAWHDALLMKSLHSLV